MVYKEVAPGSMNPGAEDPLDKTANLSGLPLYLFCRNPATFITRERVTL